MRFQQKLPSFHLLCCVLSCRWAYSAVRVVAGACRGLRSSKATAVTSQLLWQEMASMLLRYDLLPACLRRPFRESRALFFAATSPDVAVRASFQEASQIQHAGPAASGWRGRTQARSWSTAGAGTSADAVGFAVGRLGASRLPSAMSPRFDGCCWRGGGVALYRAPSATKSLSGGRSTSNQK